MAAEMDRVDALMSRIYMQRCAKPEDELMAALDAETYMDAAKAADWGFVDEVIAYSAPSRTPIPREGEQ